MFSEPFFHRKLAPANNDMYLFVFSEKSRLLSIYRKIRKKENNKHEYHHYSIAAPN